MNWSRGLFRLWLGLSVVWALSWWLSCIRYVMADPLPVVLGFYKIKSSEPPHVTDPFELAVLNSGEIIEAFLTGALPPIAVLIFALFFGWVNRGFALDRIDASKQGESK